METLKSLFVKPDPQAQMRKCNALLRSNMRKLDRDIAQIKRTEIQTKNLILQADRRAQRDPSRAKQAQREVRDFARELVRHRRTAARLVTGRAQLASVQMQVNEAFAVRKIEGSIRTSVGVMHDVNALIRLPELAGTMQALSVELMKAGIVEEMIDETLPADDMLFEDEDVEAEAEVDKVLGEILKDRMATTGQTPATPVAVLPVAEPAKAAPARPVALAAGGGGGGGTDGAGSHDVEDEEDEEDTEAMMNQMRNRLESLRS